MIICGDLDTVETCQFCDSVILSTENNLSVLRFENLTILIWNMSVHTPVCSFCLADIQNEHNIFLKWSLKLSLFAIYPQVNRLSPEKKNSSVSLTFSLTKVLNYLFDQNVFEHCCRGLCPNTSHYLSFLNFHIICGQGCSCGFCFQILGQK